MTTDATQSLRYYVGLGLVCVGGAPLLMFALLANKHDSPEFPLLPVFAAAPLIIAGIALTVVGMVAKDPGGSTRWLGAGAACVVVGDAVLFGLRAAMA